MIGRLSCVLIRTKGHRHDVRARTLNGRLALDQGEKLQKPLSLCCVIPGVAESSRAPRRTLDRDEPDIAESSTGDLSLEFLGAMEIGGGEILGAIRLVAVQPASQIPFDDFPKLRILEEASS